MLAPEVMAPPGLDAKTVPNPPVLLTSISAATAGTQFACSFNSSRTQSGKRELALGPFRPPPGLEHLRNDEFAVGKYKFAQLSGLPIAGVGEVADVTTIDTAPPSPGGTADSCDGLGSENSSTPRGLTEHPCTRLVDTGYTPGRLLIQESGSAEAAVTSDQEVQKLNLAAALQDENTTSDVGLPGQPSVGSFYHHTGFCRPCDFVYRAGGCRSGIACQFCHLDAPDERKKSKKMRAKLVKAVINASK